jgi:hypothetical protein
VELYPFNKISQIPLYPEGLGIPQKFVDITEGMDLIDIANLFVMDRIRGVNISKYRGIITYSFNGKLQFSYNEKYIIDSLEFRFPYNTFEENKLTYKNINIFGENIMEMMIFFTENGMEIKKYDYGFYVLPLGISYFSNDFEEGKDSTVNALTIFLNKSTFL